VPHTFCGADEGDPQGKGHIFLQITFEHPGPGRAALPLSSPSPRTNPRTQERDWWDEIRGRRSRIWIRGGGCRAACRRGRRAQLCHRADPPWHAPYNSKALNSNP
jgi:hypothetical protein